ncbi:MAG: hypothetical protein E7558_05995 [Ruminococcaceae bacterium]|nr:hypothetical protein [Oscillospiraceae bacterium]
MKTKKTLAILLAVMMILSALPIVSSAAEAPTVTEWPTIVETSSEVGKLRGDFTLVGGVAPVPGHFELATPTVAYTAPSASTKVTIRFVPDDTETYKNVTMPSAQRPVIEVKSCSQPTLQGEIAAKTILTGAAIGTSELSLAEGAAAMAYTKDISNRVASITFDNPDKVYTEVGTYEEPVTIKFAVHTSTGLPYAVDIKATAKIKVADKLDAEIITAPTIAAIPATDTSTAKDLTVTGGEANVEGTFAVTNPDKKIVVGENIINVTFTPADTSKYNPVTVDVTVACKGRAPLPETIIIPFTFNHSMTFKSISCDGAAAGINIEGAKLSVRSGNNSDEFLKTRPTPGDHEATALLYFSGDAANYYEREIVNVIIRVSPQKQTKALNNISVNKYLQNDGSYLIEAMSSCSYPEYMHGNVIIKVNGEVIGEERIKTSREATKFQYIAKKTGDYVVTSEYVPAADDYYVFEDPAHLINTAKTISLEITMPREVKATGHCKIWRIESETDNGLALPGKEITVLRNPIETHEKFDGWTFYDDAGNEFIPEGLAEDYMTQQEIRFIMPNHDVTVKASKSLNLGGGDEPGTDEPGTDEPGTDEPGIDLPDIDLPDIEIPDIDYDDMSQGDHNIPTVNFFKNLVKMIKDFIQQIGEFFASLRIEDLGGLITQ